MRRFNSIADLGGLTGPLVVAAGVFDGMHPGHQAVLRSALDAAALAGGTAVALTFDPHPSKILRPESAARLLTATGHKLRLMEKLGIPAVLIIRFDHTFSGVEAEDFIGELRTSAPGIVRICVGKGWRFGWERRGDVALLRRLGSEQGFETTEVAPVEIDGTMVSSSLIRQAVEAGDLKTAARFLGRKYSILGTVVQGDGVGRQLGFPTANLAAHNEQFPPDGVYAVAVRLGHQLLPGVANIGTRPTLKSSGERLLEVHLPGFSGNLYGQELEAEFLRFLRPEKKFSDLESLRRQIALDIDSARELPH